MATIRTYTTIEQSRKLAEILPLESADQTWVRIAIAGANLDVPEELQYRHNGDMPFKFFSGIGVPCWSLAALLDVLSKSAYFINEAGIAELSSIKATKWCISILNCGKIKNCYADNPVDACYEMILKLNELKML